MAALGDSVPTPIDGVITLVSEVIIPVEFTDVTAIAGLPVNPCDNVEVPLKDVVAVIIPALNPPSASLDTMVLFTFSKVALVALFGIFVSNAPDPLNVDAVATALTVKDPVVVIPVISTSPVTVSSLSDAPGLVEVLIPIFDVV